MHILVTRPWLNKMLHIHSEQTKENPHELVDRLLMGFFSMDAPWSKNGTWETPLEPMPPKRVNGSTRPGPHSFGEPS